MGKLAVVGSVAVANATVLAVCGAALAADLPRKAPLADVVPVTASPFYIGIFAGGGFSETQSELTLAGTAQGPLKAYPTGLLAGVSVGYVNTTGPLYWGLAVEAAYDFSRGDVGGVTPGTVIGSRKNGLFLEEVGELGISLSTIGGYVPSSARPSNWPVPITVPSSVWSNLVLGMRGGLAQRDVTLCAPDGTLDVNGNFNMPCATKFINGPLVGGFIKAMISGNSPVKLTLNHFVWNSSFTAESPNAKIFSATTAAKGETVAKVGFDYHF